MKALTWQSRGKITCETVPDPQIEDERDAIIKVTAACVCGSDLWPYRGAQDVEDQPMGHEYVGTVVEVGDGDPDVVDGGEQGVRGVRSVHGGHPRPHG